VVLHRALHVRRVKDDLPKQKKKFPIIRRAAGKAIGGGGRYSRGSGRSRGGHSSSGGGAGSRWRPHRRAVAEGGAECWASAAVPRGSRTPVRTPRCPAASSRPDGSHLRLINQESSAEACPRGVKEADEWSDTTY
jgi:hypothetical protein